MHMNRSARLAPWLALATLIGCAATNISSAWKDAAAGTAPFKKVMVVAMSQDMSMRRIAEDTFVKSLPKNVQGVTSYTFIPEDELKDVAKVKERCVQGGIDGVVVYHLVAVDKETRYVPGTTYYTSGAYPYYGSFGPYWGASYGMVYEPGYVTEDKIVQIESNAYAVADEKLMWTVRSETINPGSAQQVIDEVVALTVQKLHEDKVIQ
jgi:hypothetical protein